MKERLQITIIALVVATIAVTPALVMNQSAEAASHTTKCEAEKGKSAEWIKGCKDGWFNWDQCGTNYPHGSKEFYEGYKAGWEKGKANNPNVSCPNGRGL
ncbi:hypothetical protein [Candidatus Nitrosocosmicus sp. SS]|jgi:hypothetical protein|uniref:hypothetical protein n=1 Tax=Candidatus Nitrosocosmicus agrestis TaxID=2563600 RepID=UPI00122DF077|nr:hypothetical protein [Candidatus Nitrosocosmicus sp. SS]KAA2283717.1 hypothetical protein F1Z66_00030 [Candidatus Nitrosocosmicus sp. SS]KAF0867562.1 hypothetical protein E5N71_14685 [Candidatus Nitrosocosmicus sp. SS]